MKVCIFGAGQAGFMAKQWLPAACELIGFADNKSSLWGSQIDGVSVLSPKDAIAAKPDLFVLAILNREALTAVTEQLRQEGFQKDIIDISDFRNLQDIRLAAMRLYAAQIRNKNISGAVAELGVFQGEFAAELNRQFPDRTLYLLDTFEGFPQKDLQTEITMNQANRFRDFSDTSIERVKSVLTHPSKAVFVKGYFPETAVCLPEETYAFVNLDPDLYAPTLAGLEYFWPRLAVGGVIFIHDYTSLQFPGVKQAVDLFLEKEGLSVIPLMDLHGTAVLLKQRGRE